MKKSDARTSDGVRSVPPPGKPGSGFAIPAAWPAFLALAFLCGPSAQARIRRPSPPTVSLSADPSSIDSGQSSTLSWSSENASSCSGSGFSTGKREAVSGSADVSPTSTTSYSISCRGSGGKATASATVTVASSSTSSPTTATFYMALDGDDSWSGMYPSPTTNASGDPDGPFATPGAAQAAMRSSSSTVKITYIRGGDYNTLAAISNCSGAGSSCLVSLTSADSGETWSYYPPDGYDSASINGNGVNSIFYHTNVDGLTIDGLTLHDFYYAAIASLGGSSNLLVENNIIYNGTDVSDYNAAGVMCYGCATTTITHNVIHDIADFGISFNQTNGDISGLVYSYNVLYNICTGSSDCGALYMDDGAASATGVQMTYNYIRDGNTNAELGSNGGSAIYLDDCSSGVTVSGNVIAGRNGTNTLDTHGGSNDHFVGNITDLGPYQQYTAIYQTSSGSGCNNEGPMTGNEYEHNIVISAGGGGGFNLLSGSPTGSPTIADNAYWNYGGNPITTSGPGYSDSDPVTENPELSGWTYDITSGSSVYNAPVNFPQQPADWGQPGFWGPPGYVILESGTPPSSPY